MPMRKTSRSTRNSGHWGTCARTPTTPDSRSLNSRLKRTFPSQPSGADSIKHVERSSATAQTPPSTSASNAGNSSNNAVSGSVAIKAAQTTWPCPHTETSSTAATTAHPPNVSAATARSESPKPLSPADRARRNGTRAAPWPLVSEPVNGTSSHHHVLPGFTRRSRRPTRIHALPETISNRCSLPRMHERTGPIRRREGKVERDYDPAGIGRRPTERKTRPVRCVV